MNILNNDNVVITGSHIAGLLDEKAMLNYKHKVSRITSEIIHAIQKQLVEDTRKINRLDVSTNDKRVLKNNAVITANIKKSNALSFKKNILEQSFNSKQLLQLNTYYTYAFDYDLRGGAIDHKLAIKKVGFDNSDKIKAFDKFIADNINVLNEGINHYTLKNVFNLFKYYANNSGLVLIDQTLKNTKLNYLADKKIISDLNTNNYDEV